MTGSLYDCRLFFYYLFFTDYAATALNLKRMAKDDYSLYQSVFIKYQVISSFCFICSFVPTLFSLSEFEAIWRLVGYMQQV